MLVQLPIWATFFYGRRGARSMPDRMLRISVADTGDGIPVEKQGNLFKPFERLGREAGNIEGTGIGLTITRQIINLLDGQVGYESETDRGSIFWVEIPISSRHVQDLEKSGAVTQTAMETIRKNDNGPVRTILYIEDNVDNVRLMEAIIGQFSSARLPSAPNAELGIVLASNENPDLILMDINLPGMNGFHPRCAMITGVRRVQHTGMYPDFAARFKPPYLNPAEPTLGPRLTAADGPAFNKTL